jgi:hypothetical protein
MSTVQDGTSGQRAFGRNDRRPASSGDIGHSSASADRCPPHGNERGIGKRLAFSEAGRRPEPQSSKQTGQQRNDPPIGSNGVFGLQRILRVRAGSAWRVENHLLSMVRRVHWDEPIQTQVTFGYDATRPP